MALSKPIQLSCGIIATYHRIGEFYVQNNPIMENGELVKYARYRIYSYISKEQADAAPASPLPHEPAIEGVLYGVVGLDGAYDALKQQGELAGAEEA